MSEKRRTLWAMFVVSAVGSGVMMLAPSVDWANGLNVLVSLLVSFLLFVWYRIDARERGFRRRWPMNFGIAGASLFVLPYYLLRTRGMRGGALAIGGFTLGFIGLLLASVIGGLAGLVLRYLGGMPVPPSL